MITKEDKNKKAKEWYRKHKKQVSERHRKYYLMHREERKQASKLWRQNNREKIKEYERSKKRREKCRQYDKNRRLKLRFAIFKRDNFTCQYCGRKAPEVILEIDHIFPKSKGGNDKKKNYITACKECNLGKGDCILNEFK